MARFSILTLLLNGCCCFDPVGEAGGTGKRNGTSTGGAGTSGATTGETTASSAVTSGGSPASGTTSTGSAGSLTTSTGSGTGGTGGQGTSGDGGCSTHPALQNDELYLCVSDQDCGCPMTCVFEPSFGFSMCERSCQSTSDCPSLSTLCDQGTCGPVLCGPPAGNELDGVCPFESTTASCLPSLQAWGWPGDTESFGVCTQGGELGSTSGFCEPDLTRTAGLAQVCNGGSICAPPWTGEPPCVAPQCSPPGDLCFALCNPTAPGACAGSGLGCTAFDPEQPLLGACQEGPAACMPSGTPCSSPYSCCSQYCDDGKCG